MCLLFTVAVVVFLYLPIIILVLNSFSDTRFGGFESSLSLKWYAQLFQERAMWIAVRNSMIIGVSATLTSTFLGTLAACALHIYKSRLQSMHFYLIYIPLIIPDILMGISLLAFFVLFNIHLGLFTVFLAHTTFCLSYVTMVMLSKLQNFDFSIIEAAQDLGASTGKIIRRIFLPLLMPGITAAALLAFTLSVDDFVITYFVAGPGSSTLPLYIYSMIKFGSTPVINALSTIILFCTFITVCLSQWFKKE